MRIKRTSAYGKSSLTQDRFNLPDAALVFGKEITLQTYGHDKYGRTLADVLLSHGTHVNHTLIKDGLCWFYRKYAPRGEVPEGLERGAREAKKGLWGDPQPVLPWEWCNYKSLSL